MEIIYYFENNELKAALERYLLYVIKSGLNSYSHSNKKTLFLIDVNYSVSEDFLVSFHHIQNPHIIIFGNSNTALKSYVNLTDLSNLKKNIENVLTSTDADFSPLLYLHDIKIKINLFFKGHGEASLLSSLNWARYYLSNGPVLLSNEKLNWEEYEGLYLKPGLSYWNTFIGKLFNYEVYLRATGFEKEINTVKEFSDGFDRFVSMLNNRTEGNINEFKELRIKKHIDNLKQIDYIFNNIRKKLKCIYHDI